MLGQDGDADPPLFTMMRDRYANYIVQKMIELSTPAQKEVIRRRLSTQIDSLRKFTYISQKTRMTSQTREFICYNWYLCLL